MPKFRKKPVEIEAWQLPLAGTAASRELLEFLNNSLRRISFSDDGSLTIETLEGDMLAMPRDWIIKGVHGEYYPCKPDIFEKTYELL